MRRQTGTADGKIMHKVKKGDTIYKLAKRYYGDTKLWAAIYTANRKKIGSNYKQKLKPGLKIAIPLPEVKP